MVSTFITPSPGPCGSVAGQSLQVVSVDFPPSTLRHSAPRQQHSRCSSLWSPASLFSWMVERGSCVSLRSGLVRGRAEHWDSFSEIPESKGVSKRLSDRFNGTWFLTTVQTHEGCAVDVQRIEVLVRPSRFGTPLWDERRAERFSLSTSSGASLVVKTSERDGTPPWFPSSDCSTLTHTDHVLRDWGCWQVFQQSRAF